MPDCDAADRFFLELKLMAVDAGDCLQHAHGLSRDLGANAVSRQHGYLHFHGLYRRSGENQAAVLRFRASKQGNQILIVNPLLAVSEFGKGAVRPIEFSGR